MDIWWIAFTEISTGTKRRYESGAVSNSGKGEGSLRKMLPGLKRRHLTARRW